jgi:hypothetical protein
VLPTTASTSAASSATPLSRSLAYFRTILAHRAPAELALHTYVAENGQEDEGAEVARGKDDAVLYQVARGQSGPRQGTTYAAIKTNRPRDSGPAPSRGLGRRARAKDARAAPQNAAARTPHEV